jgi:hypothetical protein
MNTLVNLGCSVFLAYGFWEFAEWFFLSDRFGVVVGYLVNFGMPLTFAVAVGMAGTGLPSAIAFVALLKWLHLYPFTKGNA